MKHKIRFSLSTLMIITALAGGIFSYNIRFHQGKDEGFKQGYKQGYKQGCVDTQLFWSDVDNYSYTNFYMKNTEKGIYIMRDDRIPTPLEQYLKKTE